MLTAASAGVAAWLATPSSSGRGLQRLRRREPRARRQWRVTPVVVVGGAAGVVAVFFLGWSGLGWAISAAVASGTLTWIGLTRWRARVAAKRAKEVASAARLLSSLLRSGQIPTASLREAAADFPVLHQAAAASEMGAEVAPVLERTAKAPGAEGLMTVAAAWRVSERSGAPVAGVLQRVADSLRLEQQIAEVVETELAAARASGHIMAVLPFGAVGLGFFAGVNPLEFLFGEVLGQWLSTAAVVLVAVGVVWIERLARR